MIYDADDDDTYGYWAEDFEVVEGDSPAGKSSATP